MMYVTTYIIKQLNKLNSLFSTMDPMKRQSRKEKIC